MVRTAFLHAALATVLVTASFVAGVAVTSPGTQEELPDLVVEELSIVPEAPLEGAIVEVRASVTNAGDAPSGDFEVVFEVDGVRVANQTVFSLDPGWSAFVTSYPGHSFPVGPHVARVVADSLNQVPEGDESNNAPSLAFEVAPAPDLALLDLEVQPPNPIPGESVHFVATIANLGSVDAPLFEVGFQVEGPRPYDVQVLAGLASGGSVHVTSAEWIGGGGVSALLPLPQNNTVRAYTGGFPEGNPFNNFAQRSFFVDAGLAAVAPDGEARGRLAFAGTGDATGAVAASGLGDARGSFMALSGAGAARARNIAVSATGPASGPIAVSGTGDARSTCATPPPSPSPLVVLSPGCAAVSVAGNSEGRNAVSVLGDCNGRRCVGEVPSQVETDYVGINPDGDANGQLLAVSGTGEARSGFLAASGTGDARSSSFAVSGAGDASGTLPVSVLGTCNGKPCAAAAPGGADGEYLGVGGGDASGRFLAASAGGSAAGSLAVAPHGDATACSGTPCAAVSLTGDASGDMAASATGASRGDLAASVAGPSEGRYAASVLGPAHGGYVAASAGGPASGFAALSLLGDAGGTLAASAAGRADGCTDTSLWCTGASALGPSSGRTAASALGDATSSCAGGSPPCIAASGAGDAACAKQVPAAPIPVCAAVSGTGDARGEIAVSLTGHAEGSRAAVSGCDAAGVCL